jgi:ATP-dependent protease ClpP protease subunit
MRLGGRRVVAGDESDEEDDGPLVHRLGTHVYFYCDVSQKSVLKLFKHIHEIREDTDSAFLLRKRKRTGEPHITLHISSSGGDLYAGLAAHDVLSKIPNLTTVAEGCVASSATLLLLAARERHLTKNCSILIHQLSTLTGWLRFEEMKDEMRNTESLQKQLRGVYDDKCTFTPDLIDELMSREKTLTAQEAEQHGVGVIC